MGLMNQLSNGLSTAGYTMADTYKQEAVDQDRAQLEQQKEQRIAEFNANLAQQQRQLRSGRISDEQNRLAQQRVQSQFGGSDASVQAANAGETDAPLTSDQQNVINQAKSDALTKANNDPDLFVKAAANTGDIDPATIAALSNKTDIAALRSENFKDRTDMMQQVAQIRANAQTDAMQLRLDAAKEKASNGKIDTATGRMLITSYDTDIKAATSQIGMLNTQIGFARPDDKKGILGQIDQLKDEIKSSQSAKNAYLKQMGLPTTDSVAPTGSPAAPGSPATTNNPFANSSPPSNLDSLFPPKK